MGYSIKYWRLWHLFANQIGFYHIHFFFYTFLLFLLEWWMVSVSESNIKYKYVIQFMHRIHFRQFVYFQYSISMPCESVPFNSCYFIISIGKNRGKFHNCNPITTFWWLMTVFEFVHLTLQKLGQRFIGPKSKITNHKMNVFD